MEKLKLPTVKLTLELECELQHSGEVTLDMSQVKNVKTLRFISLEEVKEIIKC